MIFILILIALNFVILINLFIRIKKAEKLAYGLAASMLVIHFDKLKDQVDNPALFSKQLKDMIKKAKEERYGIRTQ